MTLAPSLWAGVWKSVFLPCLIRLHDLSINATLTFIGHFINPSLDSLTETMRHAGGEFVQSCISAAEASLSTSTFDWYSSGKQKTNMQRLDESLTFQMTVYFHLSTKKGREWAREIMLNLTHAGRFCII